LDGLNNSIFYERGRVYEDRILDRKSKYFYLDGYWQTEKYFLEHRNDILDLFNFDRTKNLPINFPIIDQINLNPSICLHVRRTDFINNKEHDCVDLNYYKKGLEYYQRMLNTDLTIYIFSDDMEWCKINLGDLGNVKFMGTEFEGERGINHMYLMSQFDKFIIPNSTFSWWGAWLSRRNNKLVIAPERWSGNTSSQDIDIVPQSWVKL
jgi:hypothetical protein